MGAPVTAHCRWLSGRLAEWLEWRAFHATWSRWKVRGQTWGVVGHTGVELSPQWGLVVICGDVAREHATTIFSCNSVGIRRLPYLARVVGLLVIIKSLDEVALLDKRQKGDCAIPLLSRSGAQKTATCSTIPQQKARPKNWTSTYPL